MRAAALVRAEGVVVLFVAQGGKCSGQCDPELPSVDSRLLHNCCRNTSSQPPSSPVRSEPKAMRKGSSSVLLWCA